MARISHCLDSRLIYYDYVVGLIPGNIFWHLFILEVEKTPAAWWGWKY
jgi:hypothetical protein